MADWTFQYGVVSLASVVHELIMSQVINVPAHAVNGRDEMLHLDPFRGERRISIAGVIQSNCAQNLRDSINSLQSVGYGEGSILRRLSLMDDRFIDCRMVDFSASYVAGTGLTRADISAAFLAPHPFFTGNTSYTGVNCAASTPFSFSVVNTGTAITPPSLTFQPRSGGALGNFTLDNLTTGQQLTFTPASIVMSGTNKLVVDTASFTAVDSAGTSQIQYMGGEIWRLRPGTNNLYFQGSLCNVEVTFNPRFDA